MRKIGEFYNKTDCIGVNVKNVARIFQVYLSLYETDCHL